MLPATLLWRMLSGRLHERPGWPIRQAHVLSSAAPTPLPVVAVLRPIWESSSHKSLEERRVLFSTFSHDEPTRRTVTALPSGTPTAEMVLKCLLVARSPPSAESRGCLVCANPR